MGVKVALGLGVVFAGYTVGIWGYCLVRGYDVPFSALFRSTWPGATSFGGGTFKGGKPNSGGGDIGGGSFS